MTRERDRIQENANKYIVKNCKSNYKLNGKYVCGAPRIHHYFCQNCTDCVIKQVIEECKQADDIYQKGEFYDDDRDIFMGQSNMANVILNMFDVEEINK